MTGKISAALSFILFYLGCSNGPTLRADVPAGWTVSKETRQGEVHDKTFISAADGLKMHVVCKPANQFITPEVLVGALLMGVDRAEWRVVELEQTADEASMTMVYALQGEERLYVRFLAKYARSDRTKMLTMLVSWAASGNAAARPVIDAFTGSVDCR